MIAATQRRDHLNHTQQQRNAILSEFPIKSMTLNEQSAVASIQQREQQQFHLLWWSEPLTALHNQETVHVFATMGRQCRRVVSLQHKTHCFFKDFQRDGREDEHQALTYNGQWSHQHDLWSICVSGRCTQKLPNRCTKLSLRLHSRHTYMRKLPSSHPSPVSLSSQQSLHQGFRKLFKDLFHTTCTTCVCSFIDPDLS